MKLKELTKAEEQMMHRIWQLGRTTVKAIVEKMPDPKPAVNTVSTIVRSLADKEYLGFEQVGRGYEYFPIVEKAEYRKQFMSRMMSTYFQDSFKDLVSFFAKENKIKPEELDELIQEVKRDLKKEENQ
ncbi:BlaI/MecI/CopY family transcriptional regulator [Carboxylicivirga caseinilyticus]|uniref:BlaI/MecI/CopY family transcriptional regulator n=1 Tax=Carboxylicivirga caseinilyticus TaxID=3417572 RepID=UPI003D327DFB|nr:BlaI/MecI/CopY family transcriptional regulator [Marinilabiliaceae bacterium A049]